MTQFLFQLAVSSGVKVFVMGAGIGVIVLIVSSIMNAGVKKVKSVLDPPKNISSDPKTQSFAMYSLAKEMAFEGRLDEAIAGFKRALELDPDAWHAGMMLGNLVFEKDKELSFKGLQMMERQIIAEGKNFDDPSIKDFALNYYMLGYHYKRHNLTDKSVMFQNIAMNNREFVKGFKEFRQKFPY